MQRRRRRGTLRRKLTLIALPLGLVAAVYYATHGHLVHTATETLHSAVDSRGKASAGALTGDVQQNDTGTGARTGRIFDPRGLLDKTPQELLRLMTYWKLSRPTVDIPADGPLFPVPKSQRYLTWEPDQGGLNNIRMQLETLVMLAHLTHRTFVTPDHLSTELGHLEGTASVSDFYCFGDVGRWVPVVSMQRYLDDRGVEAHDTVRESSTELMEFLRNSSTGGPEAHPLWDSDTHVLAVPGVDDPRVKGRQDPPLRYFNTHLGDLDAPRQLVEYAGPAAAAETIHVVGDDEDHRLLGAQGFIYFPTLDWQRYYWAGLRDHVHIRPDIVANASLLVAAVATAAGGAYNAVHYRSTDWAKQYPGWFVTPEQLAPRLLTTLSSDLPLFVATDNVNRTLLAPLLRAFPKVMFLEDFDDTVLPGLSVNAFGVMDQLVSSCAARFVGTFGSTFTAYIHRIRGYHSPDLVQDKEVHFVNFPEDAKDIRSSLADNARWANSAWWPQRDAELFTGELWSREFSFTWDFSR